MKNLNDPPFQLLVPDRRIMSDKKLIIELSDEEQPKLSSDESEYKFSDMSDSEDSEDIKDADAEELEDLKEALGEDNDDSEVISEMDSDEEEKELERLRLEEELEEAEEGAIAEVMSVKEWHKFNKETCAHLFEECSKIILARTHYSSVPEKGRAYKAFVEWMYEHYIVENADSKQNL